MGKKTKATGILDIEGKEICVGDYVVGHDSQTCTNFRGIVVKAGEKYIVGGVILRSGYGKGWGMRIKIKE